MAVNSSRSMQEDFSQGIVDNTYIQLAPNRGGEIEVMPVERLSWPQYAHAERHADDPHVEAMAIRAQLPTEVTTRYGGDHRY